LLKAARTLNRDTRMLPADLGALASASAELNAKFPGDESFAELEANAVADYSLVAHERLDGVFLWIGTNTFSRHLTNEVVKAADALERADKVTNGVPAHARSLAPAFNRILPWKRKCANCLLHRS